MPFTHLFLLNNLVDQSTNTMGNKHSELVAIFEGDSGGRCPSDTSGGTTTDARQGTDNGIIIDKKVGLTR